MKGLVKIDKYRAELIDGEWVPVELVDTIEETNRVTGTFVEWVMTQRTDSRDAAEWVVLVSESHNLGAINAATADSSLWYRGQVAQNASYTAPVGASDAYWEIVTTIPAGTAREIRSLACGSSDGNYNNKAYTVVNLPTPCSQAASEILQITYRLINDQSAIAGFGNISSHASETIFAANVVDYTADTYIPTEAYAMDWDSRAWGKGIPYAGRALYDTQPSGTTSGNVEWYHTPKLTSLNNNVPFSEGLMNATVVLRLGYNNSVTDNRAASGVPIKAVTLGGNSAFTGIADVPRGTLSAVQNIFGRIPDTDAADRPPYLSNDVIAQSAVDVNLIDKGDWYNHRPDSYRVPYLYRITIETGGIVGTATYKIRRRRHARWNGNNPLWIPNGLPMLHFGGTNGGNTENWMDVTTADTRKHGQTTWHGRTYDNFNNDSTVNSVSNGEAGTICQRYVWPEIISWDYDGLTFMSLQEHNWTNLDANSAQAQTFTEILQVSTDGLDVYVADASQGLYQILRDFDDMDTTNWVINRIGPPGIGDDTECRGVFHKGGTMWGGPGGVVDMKIVRGGSNYAVGDTVTITGVNGTSAAANVARVDADGAITSVAITNRGSGYIEDHIQAYVSSGNGVGASLEPIVGAGGEMWAIFNDTTDNAVYMTKMTHVLTDATSLNLDTTAETITRSGGASDFIAEGFRPGQVLHIKSAENATNDGRYTIASVTTTVITLNENIPTTNSADTQAQIYAESWEVMGETITTTESLAFNDNSPSADTIVGTGGTTLEALGFREGMVIVVSGSVSNNGTYTIGSISGNTITLDESDALTTEGPTASVTLATLTDFTITNYTGDATEGLGIIGILLDHDHADDRFAIMTPPTKYTNDGSVQQASSGWDWWSYANSTGTTAAGTTDRVRLTGDANTHATSGEQHGLFCLGPLSDSDYWMATGISYTSGTRITWGTNTKVGIGDDGMYIKYLPHRCKTNFDIGVIGRGTDGTARFKSGRVASTDFTATTYDSILAVEGDSSTLMSPGEYSQNQGQVWSQIGPGMYMNPRGNDSGFFFSFNGDGTLTGEDELPYGFWQEFGWDGTRWVLDNASARTTHAQSSFSGTSLNINSTTGAIIGTGFASTDWAGDGFEAGDIITIANAEDAANNGSYVIESLSGTTLTVTPDKLPGTTNTADTTATVVGDRALIDGLALSFDDSGGLNSLILNEYYDCHVYDGIINDNATDGTIEFYYPWLPTVEGTTFESSTIPNSDVGSVTNEPFYLHQKVADEGDSQGISFWNYPGQVGPQRNGGVGDIIVFSDQQIPASTDFVFRSKFYATQLNDWLMGVAPYSLASDATSSYATSNLDYNIKVEYDFATYPLMDQYIIEVRNTGTGTVQSTYNADRVVLIEAQDETNYDGTGSNGTFIGGLGTASDNHEVGDVITMDDGTTVTIPAGGVDGNGTITNFDITTNSTKSSGNSQIGAVSSSAGAGEIDFNTTGNIISRNAGGSFVTDGFRIGMKIAVQGATTIGNDGAYTIQSVTASQIVTEENLDTTETNTSASIDHAIVQVSTTGTGGGSGGVNFALIPGTNNLEAADVGNDEYAMHRVGTTGDNLYWTLNGVEFYTHTGGPFNAQYVPCFAQEGGVYHGSYDASIDYTIDRRYLSIGNGTTTGAADPNFRCLPTTFAGTDLLRLYYDDGSGPVEFTYITDGRTAPADGEVTILPFSGRLWFNSAQAGDTLTGNWTFTCRHTIQ
jgi:hypothetical protein